jgi:hypothetical protein
MAALAAPPRALCAGRLGLASPTPRPLNAQSGYAMPSFWLPEHNKP